MLCFTILIKNIDFIYLKLLFFFSLWLIFKLLCKNKFIDNKF